MLKMAQKQYIKHLYENEEKSLREIARVMDLSFQTVKKYAYEENWNEEHLPNVEASHYPLLGPYISTIDQWLEDDRRSPRKQRHTATRIHARLVEECGFGGQYSCVKKYVRKKRYLMREQEAGYLPLWQPMGNAQVDFGKMAYLDGQGRKKDGYALTVSFPYSNHALTQVFPAQNQECLLTGLKRIFAHIGGVPVRLRADNMATAVAQVLRDGERVLTDGFSRFMLHYRFQAEFCNPASGNEKGNVENKVGYSRRNFFVPIPVVADFDAYNAELLERCEKDAEREHYKRHVPIRELFEEERQKLLYLPEYEYEVYRYEAVKLNKYGCAVIETTSYGLSPELAGRTAQAKIYYDRIDLYYEHALLKSYPRSYERAAEILDWTQYLATLCRKPGAVEHTRFFSGLPKLWQTYLQEAKGKERKSALMLLREIVEDGNGSLCDDTLTLAQECGRTDADSLRQCYYMIAKREYRPQPLTLTASAPELHYDPNLTVYDGLTGGVSRV